MLHSKDMVLLLWTPWTLPLVISSCVMTELGN